MRARSPSAAFVCVSSPCPPIRCTISTPSLRSLSPFLTYRTPSPIHRSFQPLPLLFCASRPLPLYPPTAGTNRQEVQQHHVQWPSLVRARPKVFGSTCCTLPGRVCIVCDVLGDRMAASVLGACACDLRLFLLSFFPSISFHSIFVDHLPTITVNRMPCCTPFLTAVELSKSR